MKLLLLETWAFQYYTKINTKNQTIISYKILLYLAVGDLWNIFTMKKSKYIIFDNEKILTVLSYFTENNWIYKNAYFGNVHCQNHAKNNQTIHFFFNYSFSTFILLKHKKLNNFYLEMFSSITSLVFVVHFRDSFTQKRALF